METTQILEFGLDGHRFGIYARDVHEVLRAATPSPLPGAPAVVSGILNLRGTFVAVYDLRSRFGLPPRALEASDHFVIADAGRKVSVVVDRAHALITIPVADIEAARDLPTTTDGVAGAVRLPDGMIVLVDLREFLTEAESTQLDAALAP